MRSNGVKRVLLCIFIATYYSFAICKTLYFLTCRFMAPFTFQGGCNAQVFNTWLKTILLPYLPKGTTVVMDNAAFVQVHIDMRLFEGGERAYKSCKVSPFKSIKKASRMVLIKTNPKEASYAHQRIAQEYL